MTTNTVWLHVESTSRCNAWCPFCPRNNQGYGLVENLIPQDLEIEKLTQTIKHFPKLHTVQLCGNLGDPLAAKNIDDQINAILSFKNIKHVQIHTNGSLRSKSWWRDIVQKTKNIDLTVWFAIDGNETNHTLYRQGTNYHNIIENAREFINAGGQAIWQFILFEHNKNDVPECYNLSQSLGFRDFKLIKNVRSDSKSYHYQTGEELAIKNYKSTHTVDKNIQKMIVQEKNCMHLSYPSIYLNAKGQIKPCCYMDQQSITPNDIIESFAKQNYFPTCITSCGNQISTDKKTL